MNRHRVAALALSLGVIVGCQTDADGPPSLALGQEACAHCRMIISDGRYAAALTTEAGETAKFDDVGCLVEHEAGKFPASTRYWVRDFKSEGWLDAREAMFARSKTFASPMGFGIAAIGSSRSAGEFGGDPPPQVCRFDGLPGFIASGHDESRPHAKH